MLWRVAGGCERPQTQTADFGLVAIVETHDAEVVVGIGRTKGPNAE